MILFGYMHLLFMHHFFSYLRIFILDQTQVNQQRQDYHLELANLKSNFDKMEREKQDAHEDVSRLRIDLEDAKRANQEDNERRNEAMKATETKHAEK